MVTVRMAIMIFMGLGWQFAFEQWGVVTNTTSPYNYTLPISMSAALAAVANDVGGDCNSIGITPHASTVTIISRKTSDLSYARTVLYYIVMGA